MAEDPAGSNYITGYGYDVLDNLTGVAQGGQSRSFIYTSLGRLKSANNPESGAINYVYFDNGTLFTRTDARNITTTHTYDDVNRPSAKSYSDGTTLPVTYSYGTTTTCYAKGRLLSVSNANSSASFCYDALGRAVQSTQATTYPFTYAYNLAGGLKQIVYPSGKIVSYAFDTSGRAQKVINGDFPSTVYYAPSIQYAPHGAIASMTMGAIGEQTTFNSRLQIGGIQAGNLTLGYSYGSSDNNGNVQSSTITWSGQSVINQYFRYDGVNRLQVAAENPAAAFPAACAGSGSNWCQKYGYDAFGNRLVVDRLGLAGAPLTEPSSYNLTNNRITGTGWSYDPSGNGNITGDPSGATYEYDGENRLTRTKVPVMAGTFDTAEYKYDGDGRRVLRRTCRSSAVTCEATNTAAIATTYVYDAAGNLAAEYRQCGSTADCSGPPAGTQYLTVDHLGSTRMVTNASGTVTEARDYLPFGEVVPNGGPRSGIAAYGLDAKVAQLFTSKERDAETGLDYFGIRYMSASMGRFTSPDSIANDWELANPQTWNRYTYARNSPLIYVDPDGAAVELIGDAKQREAELQILRHSVGTKEAASRIDVKEVKDGDHTRYFVAIKGDVGDFMGMSAAAHDLANIASDKVPVVEFGLTKRDLSRWGGAATFDIGEDNGNKNVRVLVNGDQMGIADSNLGYTFLGKRKFAHQFNPNEKDTTWRAWAIQTMTVGIATWHEFGHAWGAIHGRSTANDTGESEAWENRMRQQVYGPLGPKNAPRKRE